MVRRWVSEQWRVRGLPHLDILVGDRVEKFALLVEDPAIFLLGNVGLQVREASWKRLERQTGETVPGKTTDGRRRGKNPGHEEGMITNNSLRSIPSFLGKAPSMMTMSAPVNASVASPEPDQSTLA